MVSPLGFDWRASVGSQSLVCGYQMHASSVAADSDKTWRASFDMVGSIKTMAAAAMVAAALAACNNPQGDPAVKTTTVQQPAAGPVDALGQIEAATGIRLPPGTTVIQHARASDSDALVRARLAMSPEQLSAFLGALSLTPKAKGPPLGGPLYFRSPHLGCGNVSRRR
jgi:hypothetical protein